MQEKDAGNTSIEGKTRETSEGKDAENVIVKEGKARDTSTPRKGGKDAGTGRARRGKRHRQKDAGTPEGKDAGNAHDVTCGSATRLLSLSHLRPVDRYVTSTCHTSQYCEGTKE